MPYVRGQVACHPLPARDGDTPGPVGCLGGPVGLGHPTFGCPPVGLQGWALCWGWAQLSSRHTQGPRVLPGR